MDINRGYFQQPFIGDKDNVFLDIALNETLNAYCLRIAIFFSCDILSGQLHCEINVLDHMKFFVYKYGRQPKNGKISDQSKI